MRRKTPVVLAIFILTLMAMIGCGINQIPQVGDKAPAFTLQGIDGKNVSLSDFQGKTILVVFTSTKCTDCEIQRPFIEAVYKEYGDKLAVVDIYMFNAANSVRDYINEKGYTTTLPALPDLKGAIGSNYGVTIRDIPTSFFIDQYGIIKSKHIGRFQSQKEIEDILKSL